MRDVRSALFLVLVLAGCGGPRKPGAVPNALESWSVLTSTLEFGACGDEPGFRGQISPRAAQLGSVLAYHVSADGLSAKLQDCKWLSAEGCQDSEPPIVFEVVGTQLVHAHETRSPVGKEGCQLLNGQSWTGTDEGTQMSMDISNALSLVDAPTACDKVDDSFRQQSPNGQGLQGCIFTWKMTLERALPY